MTFERTSDDVLIRAIVTHPKIWPWVADDFTPQPEVFEPNVHPLLWWVICRDGEKILGMWLLAPHNGISWEVHTFLLPHHGLERGRRAGKEFIAWVWSHTSCRRLWTHVPTFNRLALRFAQASGMTEFGVNPQSFLHHGIPYDQILLGMSKPSE